MTSTNASSTRGRTSRTIELPYDREQVRAEKGRRILEAYVRAAWGVVEPETPYHSNWHVGAICYHLEAITGGEIRNLLVNVPPGFMKSLLVSVFWPTWEWGPKGLAHLRYLCASNGRELAVRDTLRARRLIQSDWYRHHYGAAFALTGDQNRKMRFDNDRGGSRFATSVGSGTGERANRVIFDDPNELDDAHHPERLRAAVEYNNVTLDSRLADREKDAKVVVQQRIADGDVSGDILRKMERGGRVYEVLCLPMRHDPVYQEDLGARNTLSWKDPRKEPGELLDPERYTEASVREDEVNYGDRAAAILDQRPQSGSALVYKKEFWGNPRTRYHLGSFVADQRTGNEDPLIGRYNVWDTAERDNEASAYTARAVFHLHASYRTSLVRVDRWKLEFPALLSEIETDSEAWNFDGLLSGVVVEDKSSGVQALQSLAVSAEEWLADLLVPFEPAGRSKDERDKQAAVFCRAGGVLLPYPSARAEWFREFTEDELFVGTPEKRDRRDAFTMGVLFLSRYLAEWRRSEMRRQVGVG